MITINRRLDRVPNKKPKNLFVELKVLDFFRALLIKWLTIDKANKKAKKVINIPMAEILILVKNSESESPTRTKLFVNKFSKKGIWRFVYWISLFDNSKEFIFKVDNFFDINWYKLSLSGDCHKNVITIGDSNFVPIIAIRYLSRLNKLRKKPLKYPIKPKKRIIPIIIKSILFTLKPPIYILNKP